MRLHPSFKASLTLIIGFIFTITMGCQNQTEKQENTESTKKTQNSESVQEPTKKEALKEENMKSDSQTYPTSKETLKSQLDKRKAGWLEKAETDKVTAYDNGIKMIRDIGLLDKALKKGDKAPDFTLKNAVGEEIKLSEALKKGPVVVTWYRGGWCPYCNLTLQAYHHKYSEMQALNAQLFALTPETPDKSLSTKEKHDLKFQVLSDIDNQVGKKFSIVFEVPDEVMKYYNQAFSLKEYNGNDKNELPLAAAYVIQPDQTISYAYINADYRNRAEPDEIIKHLKANTGAN